MRKIKDYWVTAALIVINIAVFLVVDLSGSSEDTSHMLRWGADYAPFILQEGQYYRLFTSMFLHFGMEHLLNNMLVLGAFGERMEPILGWWKFLLIYLVGGLGGNLLSLARAEITQEYAVSAGASGAVFAVTGAMLYVLLYHRGRYQNITTRRLAIMIALSLYLGYRSGGVDNAAHLGGLAAGFVCTMVLYHPKRTRRR